MNTIATTISIPSWFEAFKDTISSGLKSVAENIKNIASIYVEAIDKDPSFKDYISNELNEIPPSIWINLEKVGRGQLDSRIAIGSVPYKNMLSRLSFSDQQVVLNKTVTLLLSNGDTMQIQLNSMTSDQARQIFANNHIRDLSEQRAWLETIKLKASLITNHVNPIEIDKKNKCIIVKGVRLSVADLKEYVRRINA